MESSQRIDGRPPLTVAQMGKRLNVCRTTAWRLVYDGTIPHFKIRRSVRIPATAVDEYLRRVLVAERI